MENGGMMIGWIVAAVLFFAYLYVNARARFWKGKMNELYRTALKDQRELKYKIDQLEARR
jgi:hypothetical protein